MNDSLRASALSRDGYTCQECGKAVGRHDNPHVGDAEVHHITPRAKGGMDVLENLITLCGHCHKEKHTRDTNKLDEFILSFLSEHKWATPNLLRRFYNDENESVSRQWVSSRLGRLAEHEHIAYVHENADEYELVDDPREN